MFSIFLIVFAIINIITFKFNSHVTKIMPMFMNVLYGGIAINSISLLLSFFIFKKSNLSAATEKFENTIIGINFFILNCYFLFFFSIYYDLDSLTRSQAEIYVFLRIISTILKISYVWLFIKKFTVTFITSAFIIMMMAFVITQSMNSESIYQLWYSTITIILCCLIS